jgi:CPA1 family monovalent cation:H+ antiporter
VSAVVIGVRLVWVFPAAYLPRFLFKKIRERDPYPDWRHLVIIGWSGMRGVDSLATALALPFLTGVGRPFPGRDTMIFVAFVVILITLVAQGLSLPLLIRLLNIKGDGKADREEQIARVTANQAALAYVENLAESDKEHREQLNLLQAQYHERLAQLESSEDAVGNEAQEADRPASAFHRLALGALEVEHEALIDLRNKHRINDETLRVVQRDVDLAETRIREMEL